jgi:hypothetical protein
MIKTIVQPGIIDIRQLIRHGEKAQSVLGIGLMRIQLRQFPAKNITQLAGPFARLLLD